MLKCLKFIFLIIFFCGCEDYMNISKTTKQITDIAKSKYHLDPFGCGVSAPGVIKNFRISFITKIEYNEEKARKLIVDFTEDYISLINNSPEVLKYFETRPINECNAYFLINFIDKNGDDKDGLTGVRLGNGNIAFLTLDENSMFKEFRRETYSEAYFKVYGTSPTARN